MSQPGANETTRSATQERTKNNDGEDKIDSSIQQQQRLEEKPEMRDLNARLEMFVRHQREGRTEVGRLKQLLAETELSFRQRIKDSEKQFQLLQDKIVAENEQLLVQNKTLQEQIEKAEKARQSAESKCIGLDQTVARKSTELEVKDQKLQTLQKNLDALTNELIAVKAFTKASLKNDEQLTGKLQEQCDQWKAKFELNCEELAKVKARNKTQVEAYQHTLTNKSEEIEKLKKGLKEYSQKSQDVESQLRKEFDIKMAEFVQKREAQYQSEKEEWMRIFKEEYQKKMVQFKEVNFQLMETTKKLESEMSDLKAKLSRTRREKGEVEVEKRSLEEEMEKTRIDAEEMRQRKDEEIREKTQILIALQEAVRQKEKDYEMLANAKVQLDNEIALYRNILSEAEKEAGYLNLFGSGHKRRKISDTCLSDTPGSTRGQESVAMTNAGSGSKRNNVENVQQDKSKEREREEEEEEGDADENDENKNLSNVSSEKDIASKQRVCDNAKLGSKGSSHKRRRPELSEIDQHNESLQPTSDFYQTPDHSCPLQFSAMDLCNSTLEIQNISDCRINLKGFYLTNAEKTKQFALPSDRILAPNECLKIIVGTTAELRTTEGEVWWHENVWSGVKDEIARLCDPRDEEIARIEISPEMLPEKIRTRKNCLIM